MRARAAGAAGAPRTRVAIAAPSLRPPRSHRLRHYPPRHHTHNAIPTPDMEKKHVRWLVAGAVVLWCACAPAAAGAAAALAEADSRTDVVDADKPHALLARNERGANNRETCRYTRGAWSECDSKSNFRTRTLTLKKGDPASCERTKTIQKKCKKACRYEKSSWSECSATGEMSRTDLLKANSDPACDQSRRLTKKCNKNKQVKSTKDKGRRNRQ